jgi:outer membrane protein assembly factor BamB
VNRTPTAAIVVTLLLAAAAARGEPDPIEGKWYGLSGFPQDRVEIGFEFKRNNQGELKAYLFQPVINFYGLELPGPVEKEDGKYLIKSYGSSFMLKDGQLEGLYMPLGEPTSLHRVDHLPAEVPVPDLPSGPGPSWRTKLGGAIFAPAAVRDGVAYVGTTSGVFNAISIRDGSFVWAVPVGRPVHGEATVTDDAVYFTCDNGFLFKLGRADGHEVWKYDLGGERVPRVLMHPTVFEWDYRSPRPVLADGIVYVGSADGSFHAVKADTGERVWRDETGSRIRADAVIHGSTVIFGNFAGRVVALDRATGREAWKRETGAFVNASPALAGDRLIVANRGGLIVALNPDTGATLWKNLMWASAAESTAVFRDGYVYIGASDLRRITCYDPRDGRVAWRTDIYGIAWARPVVTDKVVYAAAGGFEPYQMRHVGGLCALDRTTGRILWRWAAPRGPDDYETGFAAGATLSGDRLLAGSMNGVLYAFPVE